MVPQAGHHWTQAVSKAVSIQVVPDSAVAVPLVVVDLAADLEVLASFPAICFGTMDVLAH